MNFGDQNYKLIGRYLERERANVRSFYLNLLWPGYFELVLLW
jgi:hypothetical protein